MNASLGIGGVLLTLTAAMLGAKAGQQRGLLGPETGRKAVHLAMGLTCLAFPWIFHDAWPVVLLALVAGIALAAVRGLPGLRNRLGGVLGNVERASLGEFYFAASVALVWAWSHGDKFLYTAPVAVLALADSAGALVGRRYGTIFFGPLQGRKCIEGSLAVALVAFACIGCLLAWRRPVAWEVAVPSAVLAALVGALVEAVARRGLDNLFLPVATFFVLHRGLTLEAAELAGRLGMLVLLVGLVAAGRPRWRELGAPVALVLMAYVFWAVAGWPWMLVPLSLVLACRPDPSLASGPMGVLPNRNRWARQETLGIAGSLLLWLAA
jgi:phytol kinase